MIKLHHHRHYQQQQQQLQQQQQQQQRDAIMTADGAQLTIKSSSSKQTLEVNKYEVFVVIVHIPFVFVNYFSAQQIFLYVISISSAITILQL